MTKRILEYYFKKKISSYTPYQEYEIWNSIRLKTDIFQCNLVGLVAYSLISGVKNS